MLDEIRILITYEYKTKWRSGKKNEFVWVEKADYLNNEYQLDLMQKLSKKIERTLKTKKFKYVILFYSA